MSTIDPAGATLVIGATGTTGRRTADRLIAAGHRVRAASRGATPLPGAEPVRFDWYDPAGFDAAVTGADRVYLVPPIGDPDPAAVRLPFLDRARAAGGRRAGLQSSSANAEGGPAGG
ncbi:SDR family oxidoreductase, partial [Streptomyces sp. NPDC059552]|uniref:SDR family oxidoreductase n=1 Tax=Streptomyces sp. NPDC059552 TaxID=3346862 RepID=UPI0036C0CAF3